jgi:hypothetical protein
MKENSVITNASVDNNIYSTMVTMDAELGLFKAVSKKKIIEKTPINNTLKKKIQVISNNNIDIYVLRIVYACITHITDIYINTGTDVCYISIHDRQL